MVLKTNKNQLFSNDSFSSRMAKNRNIVILTRIWPIWLFDLFCYWYYQVIHSPQAIKLHTAEKVSAQIILRNYQKGPWRQNSVFIPLIWLYSRSPRQPLNVDGNHQILLLLLDRILAIMPRSPGHFSVPVSPLFYNFIGISFIFWKKCFS